MCEFCDVEFDLSQQRDWQREHRATVAEGYYTYLVRGVHEGNRLFLAAEGSEGCAFYYPKFCPECGRKL